jgi:hypothetical protein
VRGVNIGKSTPPAPSDEGFCLELAEGTATGVDVKLGHTQAKAGMRPADGYFNSLLGMVGLNEFSSRMVVNNASL